MAGRGSREVSCRGAAFRARRTLPSIIHAYTYTYIYMFHWRIAGLIHKPKIAHRPGLLAQRVIVLSKLESVAEQGRLQKIQHDRVRRAELRRVPTGDDPDAVAAHGDARRRR